MVISENEFDGSSACLLRQSLSPMFPGGCSMTAASCVHGTNYASTCSEAQDACVSAATMVPQAGGAMEVFMIKTGFYDK